MLSRVYIGHSGCEYFVQSSLVVMPRTRTHDNLLFVFSSCPPQPVLWVSSSGAQRDSAQSVQDSATPPSGGPQCVRVILDTYVQNPMRPTPRALVSVPVHKSTCKYRATQACTLLFSLFTFPCTSSLCFTTSVAVTLFLWCRLAKLLSSAFVSIVPLLGIEMHFFVTGC